jgi:hypothetical protein
MISMGHMSRVALALAVFATVCCASPEREALIQTDAAVAEEFEQPDKEDEALVQETYESQDCHNMAGLQDKIDCYKSLVSSRGGGKANMNQMAVSFPRRKRKVAHHIARARAHRKAAHHFARAHAHWKAKAKKLAAKGKKSGWKIHAANQELNYARQAAKTSREAGAQSNIAATAQKVTARASQVTIEKQQVVDKVRKVLEKAEQALQIAKDNEAKASATAEEESERAAQLQHSAKIMSQKAAMTEASVEARSAKKPLVVLRPAKDLAQAGPNKGREESP